MRYLIAGILALVAAGLIYYIWLGIQIDRIGSREKLLADRLEFWRRRKGK